MKAIVGIVFGIVALSGCVGTNTVQTSADTVIIQTRAAPICGTAGAARTAQKQAAIATINAGYDRYVIYDAASSSNVRVSQMPGTSQTSGFITAGGNLHATTTYTPGPTIVSGGHSQDFAIKMFREDEPGADRALSARDVLGPEWEKAVKAGPIGVCN
ncbi:MAG: hypothetical protein K5872_06625 [Rhizobiaceae bacterium]|nr:hypothetical protein [Rhizobiaceae bacterium]MCV0405887.1 hypothetical protein [Rhizobiaceae bacterium]